MHLVPETALDLLEERLDEEQAAFWRLHLQDCNDCAAELAAWRQMKGDVTRHHLKDASAQDLAKAFNIFPARTDVPGITLRQVIATVTFDSLLQPAFAGARGAASPARQLVLRAEEFDIHVKIWNDGEHSQLLGQLLPRSGRDFVQVARFHLLRNGERLESTGVDDMGEFHFTDVPEGDLLSLQIDLPHLTVVGALNPADAADLQR